MTVDVLPATRELLSQVESILGPTACWCAYYRLSASEYGRDGFHREQVEQRRALLVGLLDGPVAPGILALEDGTAIGWCGLGRREALRRLTRSRTIPKVDDLDVVSIVCFLVAPGHRRQGVATALLDGAIAYARDAGVPALEAYPIDVEGSFVNSGDAHVGTVAMFEAAGFARVRETEAKAAGRHRWIMRLAP